MSRILIFVILIIIICFIVGFKNKEGFTCESSQVPVFDMKLYAYNCMSSLSSELPKCNQDQTIITNAPDNTYKCGTIYGDPITNQCSINTNDTTNYLITCDSYNNSPTDDYNNLYGSVDSNGSADGPFNIAPKDYTPFLYPTFAPPPCNVVSKLIIQPNPKSYVNTNASSTQTNNQPQQQPQDTQQPATASSSSSSASTQTSQSSTPQTRMGDYSKSEKKTKKLYTYESIPFPYLPAFKSF